MEYYSTRELKTNTNQVFASLIQGEVVITNNGKPTAMLLDISNDDLESALLAWRRAKAQLAVERMRRTAEEAGVTTADVQKEIEAARRERTQRYASGA